MSEQPQPPGTWDWSCGHTAPAMCAECYRELAQRATELAAALDKALAGPEAPIDADRWLAAQNQLAEATAFLDRLAYKIEHASGIRSSEYAADCRAMAKKLRGET